MSIFLAKVIFNLKLIINKVPDLDVKYYLKKTTLFSKLNGILLTQGEEIPHAQGKGKAPPKPWKKMKSLSRVRLFVTPWTVAYQAPLSMEFSREEYWSGLPFPSPGDLPHPGIEPGSPALQADGLLSEPPGKPKMVGGANSNLESKPIPTRDAQRA